MHPIPVHYNSSMFTPDTTDTRKCCRYAAQSLNSRTPTDSTGAGSIYFGNLEVDRLNVHAFMAMALIVIAGIIITLYAHKKPLVELSDQTQQANPVFLKVESGEDMIELLKVNDLWELDDEGAVSPLLFGSYPDNLNKLDTEIRKRVFLHGLLPIALTALEEVKEEKEALHAVLKKFPEGYRELVFSDDDAKWGRILTEHEIEFIFGLTRKYRTRRAVLLVRRVDLIPPSMIMAQAAIESSWATSRFAREGNNLFGIWTWGEKGMVPISRDEGKNHKVAIYNTILESVRAYILNINRLPAYYNLRRIRRYTMNPLKLADGLLNYSQRRELYIWEVKALIKFNQLSRYDKCFLAERDIEYEGNRELKLTRREELNVG